MLLDEKVLLFDGVIFVDPAIAIRRRTNDFIASRLWSTSQVEYADQSESEDEVKTQPAWSISLVYGLDHIIATDQAWRHDIACIVQFLEKIQHETDAEIEVEVRYTVFQWYSDHIEFIAGDFIDIEALCNRVLRSSQCPPRPSK